MHAITRQLRTLSISPAQALHSKFYCCYILTCSPPSISPTGW